MIWQTGNLELFPELTIPRSTIRSWLHRGIPNVVTCDVLSAEKAELLAEAQELRQRVAVLGSIVGLLVAIVRVSARPLDHERLPEGNGKRSLLRAIERASRVVPLTAALRIAHLSPRLATTAGAVLRLSASLTIDPAVRAARRHD